MKKILIPILLMSLLFYGLVYALGPAPSPFEKIKEYAMRASPDKGGNYVLEIQVNINDTRDWFAFGYLPQHKVICFGYSQEGALFYEEDTRRFFAWYKGIMIEIDEKTATETAYRWFRLMVKKHLV